MLAMPDICLGAAEVRTLEELELIGLEDEEDEEDVEEDLWAPDVRLREEGVTGLPDTLREGLGPVEPVAEEDEDVEKADEEDDE